MASVTIDEARGHIGDRVAYRPARSALPAEDGVISSVSDRFVFVRYGSSVTSAATDPADLTLLTGEMPSVG